MYLWPAAHSWVLSRWWHPESLRRPRASPGCCPKKRFEDAFIRHLPSRSRHTATPAREAEERWSQPPHRRALWRTAKTASPRQKRSVAVWRLEDPHLGRVVRPWVSDDPLPDELELIPSPEALHGCTDDGGDGGPPSPHEEVSRTRDLNPSGEVVQGPKPKRLSPLASLDSDPSRWPGDLLRSGRYLPCTRRHMPRPGVRRAVGGQSPNCAISPFLTLAGYT